MPGMHNIPDVINLNLRFELGIFGSDFTWRESLRIEGRFMTPVVMNFHAVGLSQSILIQTASG